MAATREVEEKHMDKAEILTAFVTRIKEATLKSRSESKLEGELNQVLKELLGKFDVDYDPAVNETLKELGLSQVSSDRPDSLFGHVVLDYKKPNLLSNEVSLLRE